MVSHISIFTCWWVIVLYSTSAVCAVVSEKKIQMTFKLKKKSNLDKIQMLFKFRHISNLYKIQMLFKLRQNSNALQIKTKFKYCSNVEKI